MLAAVVGAQAPTHTDFEAPQVHPMAITADGLRLLAVNTPDGRLNVYSLLDPSRPVLQREIQVGVEPVSVAVRSPAEAWVVNHVSDSVSVVDLANGLVIDTIYVEDEPMDVAFAAGRAFVSIAGNRVVRVFDAQTRQPIGDVAIFGQDPAALLTSRDGATVWVAAKLSGNQTTVVPEALAPPPPPPTNTALPPPPRTSLIVAASDPQWQAAHGVVLPDFDVFALDAVTLQVRQRHAGVGTILFGMAEQPSSGALWVANTDARNLQRFAPVLRGHAVDHRVTRIGAAVTPIDLNPGIDYALLPNPAALSTVLAQPTDLVWSVDGSELYVAAFATDRIGVLDTAGNVVARIEVGAVTGAAADPRRKRGPRGLALHPSAARLYVANRLANTIAVVDTARRALLREVTLADPTDPARKAARGFLYDAKLSGNGTMSCAVCHVDGAEDGLAWDLGDPAGSMATAFDSVFGVTYSVHPMKGPLLTQTLRGLDIVQPYYWRGDRARLQDFNEAFDSLMGGPVLPAADMDAFAAFLTTLRHPSNPNLALDGSLATTPAGSSQLEGLVLYAQQNFRATSKCVDCHAQNQMLIPGSFFGRAQVFNMPALRNTYKHARRTAGVQGSVTGFGMLHDGTADSVFDVLANPFFGNLSVSARRALEAFVLAIDTGTPPIVGYARSVDAANVDSAAVTADLALLSSQAGLGRAELIGKGELDGRLVGFLYDPVATQFVADRSSQPAVPWTVLLGAVRGGRARLTFQAVPAGSGRRLGIDRDLDGVRDGDEGIDEYGVSTPGCSGAIRLWPNGPARVGDFGFAVSAAPAATAQPGVLLIGQRASVPLLGIQLLVDVTRTGQIAIMSVDAAGVAVLPLPVPPAANLIAQVAHLQAVFTSSCTALGLAASQGVILTIGQ